MAALLALGAAAAYGIGDFLGGVAARRVAASAVVLWSHVVGLVLLVGLAPLAGGEPTSRALAVGALAGVLGGGGVALFYRGLAVGAMSVVAPVAALLSAGVPVVVGLATGERPASAALVGQHVDGGTRIVPKFDDIQERWTLRVERMHHGNLKVGLIDEDLLLSGDYLQLRRTAETLAGLFGNGAVITRGEKKQAIASFAEAMKWLLNEVERGIAKQRYKGLGEMNPGKLWETTMDPKVRRLLKVQIDDAIAADEIFTTLMGELVEPRRAFIESNALNARIDI